MYDYSTDYMDVTSTASTAAVGGAMVVTYVISLAISVLAIVAMWKIFTKAGKPGWASIVPVYNIIVLFQICGMNPLLILLLLIPIANIIVYIMALIKLAGKFGKGGGFAAGLIFFNFIFMARISVDNIPLLFNLIIH